MSLCSHVDDIALALHDHMEVGESREFTSREFLGLLSREAFKWGLYNPRQVAFVMREFQRRGLAEVVEETRRAMKVFFVTL